MQSHALLCWGFGTSLIKGLTIISCCQVLYHIRGTVYCCCLLKPSSVAVKHCTIRSHRLIQSLYIRGLLIQSNQAIIFNMENQKRSGISTLQWFPVHYQQERERWPDLLEMHWWRCIDSDSNMLDVLKSKCRQNGSRQNGCNAINSRWNRMEKGSRKSCLNRQETSQGQCYLYLQSCRGVVDMQQSF